MHDAVLGRAEHLVVAVDRDEVGVARDAPEPVALGLGMAVHGVLAAQHLEHLVVATGPEDIRIEQVDVARAPPGDPLSRPGRSAGSMQTRTDSSFVIGVSSTRS